MIFFFGICGGIPNTVVGGSMLEISYGLFGLCGWWEERVVISGEVR